MSEPSIGHNSETEAPSPALAKDRIRSIVERVERLESERKELADDVKDIFSEAKGAGFDVKALRTIIRMRKMDPNDRAEQETILETYLHAMGMLA